MSQCGPLTKEQLFEKFIDFLNDPELKLLNRSKFREIVDRCCVVKEGNRIALKSEQMTRTSMCSLVASMCCLTSHRERHLREGRAHLGVLFRVCARCVVCACGAAVCCGVVVCGCGCVCVACVLC